MSTAAQRKPLSAVSASGRRLWDTLRNAFLKRLQALNGRERVCIVLMLLAVLAGLELLWIAPLHDKRVAIEAAALQQETHAIEAEQARLMEQSRDAAALKARSEAVEQALARLGSARAPQAHQSLGAWLDQALAGQAVRLVALRDLEPESVSVEPLVLAGAAADTAAPNANANANANANVNTSAGSATPTAPLHRLKFELQLLGEPAALAQAAQTLAERMAPLRMTRLHLARTEAGTVQATLLFVILAPEREWIRL
jgi:hypothetical protein